MDTLHPENGARDEQTNAKAVMTFFVHWNVLTAKRNTVAKLPTHLPSLRQINVAGTASGVLLGSALIISLSVLALRRGPLLLRISAVGTEMMPLLIA